MGQSSVLHAVAAAAGCSSSNIMAEGKSLLAEKVLGSALCRSLVLATSKAAFSADLVFTRV